MAFKALDAGGVLRTITSMRVNDGAATRDITTLKVMDADGTTLRTIATFVSDLAAAITPSSAAYLSESSTTITSDNTTCTPSGGLAPYSYAWTVTAGASTTILSPTMATTKVRATGLTNGETRLVGVQCVVTDAQGTAVTATATLQFDYFNASEEL